MFNDIPLEDLKIAKRVINYWEDWNHWSDPVGNLRYDIEERIEELKRIKEENNK